jgi:hypothetical protein
MSAAVVVAAVATIVVFAASIVGGRWLQRKGRDMEEGRHDAPR